MGKVIGWGVGIVALSILLYGWEFWKLLIVAVVILLALFMITRGLTSVFAAAGQMIDHHNRDRDRDA